MLSIESTLAAALIPGGLRPAWICPAWLQIYSCIYIYTDVVLGKGVGHGCTVIFLTHCVGFSLAMIPTGELQGFSLLLGFVKAPLYTLLLGTMLYWNPSFGPNLSQFHGGIFA